MDQLYTILETVCDEETFLDFLAALRDDRDASIEQEKRMPSAPFGPDALQWENTTIERFLDAAVRWAEASKSGLPLAEYTPSPNAWRRCAEILYVAKSYE